MNTDSCTTRTGASVFLAFVMALATTILTGTTAPATASSIKVVVNDEAITSLDLQARTSFLRLALHLDGAAAAKQAREELIDEAVRMQEAKRLGISVPEEKVDTAIANIASNSHATTAQLSQALSRAGVPISTLKDRIRAQIAWVQIVRGRLQQQIRADNADLLAQMRSSEKPQSSITAFDYVVQKIVFVVPKGASKDQTQSRKREADALRNRFNGCDSGLELAKKLNAVGVMPPSRMLAAEVPMALRQSFVDTAEGKLTPPGDSDYGIEMYAICQKTPVTGEGAVGASGIDAAKLNQQGEALSKKMTQELRKQANIIIR